MSGEPAVGLKKCALGLGLGILVGLAVFSWTKTTPPEELPLPKMMRIGEAAGAKHLEVPVLHYKGADNEATVDFVSAVHIGDRSYYEALNQLFTQYDAVLFELIADRAVARKLERHGKRDSTLGSFQRLLADYCGLAFQLDLIDYSAQNFVHADLSPEALQEAMKARGETPVQLILRLLRLSFDPKFERMLKESGYSGASLEGINPLLIVLRGPTDAERMKIKRFMAQGLTASESVLSVLEGENGISIIDDRNARIVQVLRDQLGLKKRRIAIFYGAGHAPDLHERLRKELGLKLYKIDWLSAWDLGA